jgi:glycosyltransferase involved in cell wall biosynthesis
VFIPYGIIHPMPRICIFPKATNVGGVQSFQLKMVAALQARGIEACFDPLDIPYNAILVTGGTRRLGALQAAHRRGVRIVQRLDGINWIHRRVRTGIRHYLRAEYGNLLLRIVRTRLADHIIYQSDFARRWYEEWYGETRVPWTVVHNGVDLQTYTPEGSGERPADRIRLLVVEGNMGGGYEMGLDWAIQLAGLVAKRQIHPVELRVAGKVPPERQSACQTRSRVPITWAGIVPRERIPELDRSAHLLFSADVHPACPNSVIEALACGLPVVAFDTGSLAELVPPQAGRVVPYGSNPWKIEPPDLPSLAEAAVQVLADMPRYQRGARQRAEEAFGLDRMVEGYLAELAG